MSACASPSTCAGNPPLAVIRGAAETSVGAPLDNNICERALKLAVLQRKNALFYKTTRGAAVGDRLMSVIETCRLNEVNSVGVAAGADQE